MEPTDVTTIRAVPVTRLGLGSAPLGGLFNPVTDEAAGETVRKAVELGLRYFDTAPLYGYGAAERRVGGALAGSPRESFTVQTKVGRLLREPDPGQSYDVDTTQSHDGEPFYKGTGAAVPVFDFSYDGALRSLEESLRRLGLDRIDIALVHDPDDHMDEALTGACRAMIELRDQGVVGAVGVGIDNAEPAARFVEEADIDCVLIAGRWTLLDQTAGGALLPRALERGTAVIAAGVFNSGVLASPDLNPTFDYVPCPPEILERAKQMATVCASYGVSLKAVALQFPFRHPAVRAVVTGARSPEELEENTRLMRMDVPTDLWAELSARCAVPLQPDVLAG